MRMMGWRTPAAVGLATVLRWVRKLIGAVLLLPLVIRISLPLLLRRVGA